MSGMILLVLRVCAAMPLHEEAIAKRKLVHYSIVSTAPTSNDHDQAQDRTADEQQVVWLGGIERQLHELARRIDAQGPPGHRTRDIAGVADDQLGIVPRPTSAHSAARIDRLASGELNGAAVEQIEIGRAACR